MPTQQPNYRDKSPLPFCSAYRLRIDVAGSPTSDTASMALTRSRKIDVL
jgi:hypothetical protein